METNQPQQRPQRLRHHRFIGQVRYRGARLWTTVTGKCHTGENALNWAVKRMGTDDVHARALTVDCTGWPSDNPVLEARR